MVALTLFNSSLPIVCAASERGTETIPSLFNVAVSVFGLNITSALVSA